MTLERGAGAEGNDRRLVLGAQCDDLGDLFGALHERDGVGRMRRVIGFVLAVLRAHRRRGRQTVAQALAQRIQQFRIEGHALEGGRGHQ